MADQHTTARLPQLEARGPKSATITVTLRDGDTVTTPTWSSCHGVAGFVADLLGEPGARAVLNAREASCP